MTPNCSTGADGGQSIVLALDGNDHVIHDAATGTLYFDGAGGMDQLAFGLFVSRQESLVVADFFVGLTGPVAEIA